MKERELDDLERLFRNGLKDLEAEPDEAVWKHIKTATGQGGGILAWFKRFRILLPLLALVSLGGIILLSPSDDKSMATDIPGSGTSVPNEQANPDLQVGQEQAAPSVSLTENSQVNTPSEDAMQKKPQQKSVNQKPRTSLQKNPPTSSVSSTEKPTTLKEQPFPKIPIGREDNTGMEIPVNFSPDEIQDARQSETPLSIRGKVFTFGLAGLQMPTLSTLPKRESTEKEDNNEMKSAYFAAYAEMGTLIPSVKSIGIRGDYNFDKSTDVVYGGLFQFGLQYTFKSKWSLRSGLGYSRYTLKGSYSYYGYIDTLEWIDRDLNTGVYIGMDRESGEYDIQYSCLQVPLEIGGIQSLGSRFEWNWSLGTSMNFLTGEPYFTANKWYLAETNQSLKKTQWQWMFGFGASYALNKHSQVYVQTRYQYQPGNIYNGPVFSEKHHYLSFRMGMMFYLSKKGGSQ